MRHAIESWDSDLRVALISSGGLSHFVVDEELDQMVIDSMRSRSVDALADLGESWFQCRVIGNQELGSRGQRHGRSARQHDPGRLYPLLPQHSRYRQRHGICVLALSLKKHYGAKND
ncbi:hypothetical protein [Neopusillimonas aromaticivorans]|uniref:hypothetical protein n=1 Tax=Neopusillimonas aromaticivorans TaxID=2979868 RepID=UPI002597FFF4|nr:hypothetical protein [Neopusillimonas aromaticivorans]WJJ94493.1 hypothetical protein N7E01_05880 [Neopusillimonas aromaticivorans]